MSDNTNAEISQTAAEKMGGAKKKNGHKMSCSCHICENMKNKAKNGGYEEDAKKEILKKKGGSKKKNGHKPDCTCPICKNMKNKMNKKGGAETEDNTTIELKGGKSKSNKKNRSKSKTMKSKRSNGHKANCTCPICNNMRKKSKKGGDGMEVEGTIEEKLVEKPEPKPEKEEMETEDVSKELVKVADKSEKEGVSEKVSEASDEEYDKLESIPEISGGKKKRKSRKRIVGKKAKFSRKNKK